MNLDEWLAQCTTDLAEAETALQAAQQRVTELRTIQEGIQLAKERYGHEDQTTPLAGQSRSPKATSSGGRKTRRKAPARRPQRGHSDLCMKVLMATSDKQIASTTAREVLAEQGHELDAEQVRNGFAYLVRKGLVIREEAGLWALKPSADANHTAASRDVEPDVTALSSV
jgi:hypothetical protein